MPSVAIIGTRGYPSYYGGFETAVRKLAPYLADHGWDVTVYGRPGFTQPEDPDRDPRVASIATWGIENRSLSTLTYGFSAVRHSRRQRPDVALVMNVANGFWLPMLDRADIPTLVNVDGIEWERAKWGRVAKAVFHTAATWTARHGTRMVYDSHEISRRWAEEFGTDGHFIPYGGDVPTSQLPLEPGLSHRGYVLMVARFVPENSIAEFFAAAPAIAAETDVVIVGSTGYGGQFDSQARQLSTDNPRIHWLGHVSDDRRLHSLWQHAGVYFHGHSVGGTNPALVQAMACGAPTVARDTPYNREVLPESSPFVDATATTIYEAVTHLAHDPYRQEELSAAGLERVTSSYSWEGVCSAYESALASALARQEPRRQS